MLMLYLFRQQGIRVTLALAGIARDMQRAVGSILAASTFKASSGWIKGFKESGAVTGTGTQ